MSPGIRIEHDLLGNLEVPDSAYYGVHSLRAVRNFQISGIRISAYPELVTALVSVKQAAALANQACGLLDADRTSAIVDAAVEIRGGALHDQFVIDVIQGGAGTSTNMNANEVIANRALELLGHRRGEYEYLHPIEHVNLSQSTNDVYPTAVKLALQLYIHQLTDAMDRLRRAFAAKAEEFSGILKIGRTQLQDAVPMTLGDEFGTYAGMLNEDIALLKEGAALIREINLGATAIGTGVNAPPGYSDIVCAQLSDISGIALTTASNLIEATQDVGAFVQLSGILKRIAVKLSKTCNDLRLLSSGPRAGFNEINLPPRQAGSSIMPGKVNPVIPEVVNQVAFEVIGNDVTVSFAAEGGQLQLNAFEPIIAHTLFKSLRHMRTACDALRQECVEGITANRQRLQTMLDNSMGMVTVLNSHIGYTKATEVARRALATGRSVRDVVLEMGLMTVDQIEKVMQAENPPRSQFSHPG